MIRTALTLLALCITDLTYGQTKDHDKLIELGKTYKDFMFRNEPNKETIKGIKANTSENLRAASEFIAQTITTINKLLTQQFLTRPDNIILKQIFM